MKKLKYLVIVVLILAFPSVFIFAFEQMVDAIRWIVFMDNAETGLPLIAEIIVKAICETVVCAVAILVGVSRKNPLVSVISIIVGFLVCIGIYFICKYIVWIVACLSVILVGYLVYLFVRAKKKKQQFPESPIKES